MTKSSTSVSTTDRRVSPRACLAAAAAFLWTTGLHAQGTAAGAAPAGPATPGQEAVLNHLSNFSASQQGDLLHKLQSMGYVIDTAQRITESGVYFLILFILSLAFFGFNQRLLGALSALFGFVLVMATVPYAIFVGLSAVGVLVCTAIVVSRISAYFR